MQLSPKAIRFIVEALEYYQAYHEERLQDNSISEDECADLTNDYHYLEAIRTDLTAYRHEQTKKHTSYARVSDPEDLTLEIRTNKRLYVPGEDIIVTASATRPDQAKLTSYKAQIEVRFFDESRGQLVKTISLRDDGEPPDEEAGDGVYTGSMLINGANFTYPGSLLIIGEAASDSLRSPIYSSRIHVSGDEALKDN